MDNKTQQSKSKYGTLTASADANNDYSQGSASASTMSGASSGTMSGASGAGTMTAKFDANNDYGGGKSGKQNQGSSSNQQAGNKKVLTSNKNIGN
jgi:hypothetical protein